jgi:hypothetical protein
VETVIPTEETVSPTEEPVVTESPDGSPASDALEAGATEDPCAPPPTTEPTPPPVDPTNPPTNGGGGNNGGGTSGGGSVAVTNLPSTGQTGSASGSFTTTNALVVLAILTLAIGLSATQLGRLRKD